MKTFQKVSNHDLLFPFSFVFQDKKSPQKELSDHMHDYYEIVYVYSGKGTFFIGEVFYDMQPGDVFLIPNNTIHRAMPNQDDPIMSTIIFFSPTLIYNNLVDDSFSYLHLFDATKKDKNYKISLPPEKQPKIEEQLLHIYQETMENKLGSKHASLLIVHRIMLDLCRIRLNNEQNMSESTTYSLDWIKDILAYINDHLSEPLTLTKLAKKSLVSPSHFSRVFKETTGIGLIVYVNTKRIIKAKELLLETNYTISHIAELCGFESMPHFHRIFKKYMDRTPANYRKEYRKS
ncbi:helix-turn-helix domain-containing protein [Peribacillus asahii]|uniref:helix-turn-helix domain-containing protein n=1 Tax=Peribacillus asahii TaxID=228899 RepID=UPI002079C53C|nr:helix-turn-helix domain-containing protein [Peribacillus asahii]USK58176.1 AraC family transcriptional regulator [Peribacillus asahii]